MSTAQKQKLSIVELLKVNEDTIELAPGVEVSVHPLNLTQMVTLFAGYREAFLSLYSQAVDEANNRVNLAPVLLAAPDMVAKIIALAVDREDEADQIRDHVAATLQLIAVEKIFRLSVPDPKKAGELLSVVTGMLRKLADKPGSNLVTMASSSPTTSPAQ